MKSTFKRLVVILCALAPLAATPSLARAGAIAADKVPPAVTAFSIAATSASLTVPITAFAATDNVAVTGYLVTQSASPPGARSAAWTASPPSRYTVGAAGQVTLYSWAKDKAGNVSAAKVATCIVSLTDTTTSPAFHGGIVLGAPTASSIKANILSTDRQGLVYLEYGTTSGKYDRQSQSVALVPGQPVELALDGLVAATRYYYRLVYQAQAGSTPLASDEYRFQTARPAGSAFSFTIQADSHLDENSDLALYRRTLMNIAADGADFHIDLGDTFMCEKHSEPFTAIVQMATDEATVDRRYAEERDNFAIISHSAPLFLVNGNHEGEAGWLNDGGARNIAVWTTRARQKYFVNPVPDGYYSGDDSETPWVGKRASWYAWQWGDAQFIVLDPYWNTTVKSNADGWALTLGDSQYRWLQETLATSTAKYKFVFVHNLTGGLDGQMRGGIEAAPYFEWGGRDLDGSMSFASKRPGWGLPIHQLLLRHGVTAVFHGHDHLYAKQVLDGIVYQEVPQPSAKNSNSGASLAAEYHYASGTILSSSGYLRVSVAPEGVKSEYVRAWLPADETAQRRNGEVADTWSIGAGSVANPAPAPGAEFSSAPATPVAGQTVQFVDASLGRPTSWNWTFGDGATSAEPFPSHAYTQAGRYKVILKVANASGSDTVNHTVVVSAASGTQAFHGSIVLGSPTDRGIKVNLYSPDQGGSVYLVYGTTSGAYDRQTGPLELKAGVPLELALEALQADTRYFYRLMFQATGTHGVTQSEEYGFHTARPPGASFTFAIQGNSHPERERSQFNPELYRRTLQTAATDVPDFYITLGDDFSVDTLDPSKIDAGQVTARYTLQRPYLGLIGRSAPLFLVNGNHEQAARYLLDGTPDNIAVWAQNARNALYSQPAPDDFYSGNLEQVPFIGLLRDYYAWTWGDALFVVIDPYWASPTCVDEPFGGGAKRTDLWDVSHGDAQYQWLKATLEQSHAKYKFVFAHHVMGTGRGGVELAHYWEWGGANPSGTWGFAAKRPTWAEPLHQLMADNQVTIFFQGHDHIWVRQQLDGVTYQTLSEPADPYYALYNADAYLSGDKLPNTGYTRVAVSPEGVKVDYVRTYLPADETPGRTSGATAFSYTLP
jgi:PKD repeat protein